MLKALKITIIGMVQGVGFRPSIYRIARETGVYGYIRNMGGSEVDIHIEGDEDNIRLFLNHIESNLPTPAKIENILIEEVEVKGFREFKILPSGRERLRRSIVPPDLSICRECLDEVDDIGSRWYRYPFNSCAYCGPRYSMMIDTPYDRENTSMVDFPLCRECSEEYNDQSNIRRFHAQGISCPRCGPRIWLVDKNGIYIKTRDPIKEAAELIDDGYIISIKGLGGFHIASSATDDDTVLELRRRKNRPQKPLAIMARDIEALEEIVSLDENSIRILISPEHPILLLPKKSGSPLSRYIAPGLEHIGVFLPYTSLHHILLSETREPYLIMTSGNPEGEPMCIKNTEAITKLKNIVDYHLLHNRRIINRVDDSVLRYTDDRITFLRRGRGYSPYWIKIPTNIDNSIIAFGAMLQNTGGIGFDDKAVITQFIGDTDNLRTLIDLKLYIKRLCKLYKIDVEEAYVTIDKHPTYPTRTLAKEWAEEHNSELIEIQHHWAHITSVFAENNITGEYPGIAIDGAGYGDDGNIWGGEVLIASLEKYRRLGHIEYYPMPGGDIATEYPARILAGILYKKYDENEIRRIFKRHKIIEYGLRQPRELDIIFEQLKDRSPQTSSIGRVLDAISTLLGVSYRRTYEGEPAMKLEAYSKRGMIYIEMPIWSRGGKHIISVSDMLVRLVELLEEGVDKRVLAYNVQWVLGRSLAEVALKAKKDLIAVSGGAAVNTIILNGINKVAVEHGVRVVVNNKVPPGDGGISLGQILIASRYCR